MIKAKQVLLNELHVVLFNALIIRVVLIRMWAMHRAVEFMSFTIHLATILLTGNTSDQTSGNYYYFQF